MAVMGDQLEHPAMAAQAAMEHLLPQWQTATVVPAATAAILEPLASEALVGPVPPQARMEWMALLSQAAAMAAAAAREPMV